MPTLPGETLFGIETINHEAYEAVLLHGSQVSQSPAQPAEISWGTPTILPPSSAYTFLEPDRKGGLPRDNGLVLDYSGGEYDGYVTYGPLRGMHHCLLVVTGVDTSNLTFLREGHHARVLAAATKGKGGEAGHLCVERSVQTNFFMKDGCRLTIHASTMPMPAVERHEDGTAFTFGVQDAARQAIKAAFPKIKLPPLTTTKPSADQ